ncbi:MAG: hypothetical protein ACJ8CC_22665, partial [Microvirga sp.]
MTLPTTPSFRLDGRRALVTGAARFDWLGLPSGGTRSSYEKRYEIPHRFMKDLVISMAYKEYWR